jgi:hypothetical protein
MRLLSEAPAQRGLFSCRFLKAVRAADDVVVVTRVPTRGRFQRSKGSRETGTPIPGVTRDLDRSERVGRLGRTAAWLVPVAAAAVAAIHQGCVLGGDAPFFEGAARTLLSAHWSSTFSNPAVQAGPLELALFGAHSAVALALALATASALLVVATAHVIGVRNPALLGGAGVLAVVTGLTTLGYTGHPADTLIPLIWVLAAADARRGHSCRAGLLVGACAGLETWGLLGVAVLALAPRRRDAAIGAVAAGAVALALFGPFILGGHFAMGSFAWVVRPPAPMSLVVPAGTPFGWPLRLAQGVLSVGAGVAVARLFRHSPHALWMVPLATVATRLLFDPLLISYYLAAPQGPIYVGAALGASRLTLHGAWGAASPPASRPVITP